MNQHSCGCRTLSQLKRIARASYSNPPVHGARIVAEVVNDGGMFDDWKAEMEMMSGRIKGVRQLLHDELMALYPEKDWGFILSQIGMFSFTGAVPVTHDTVTITECDAHTVVARDVNDAVLNDRWNSAICS